MISFVNTKRIFGVPLYLRWVPGVKPMSVELGLKSEFNELLAQTGPKNNMFNVDACNICV